MAPRPNDPTLAFCRNCGAVQFTKTARVQMRSDYEKGDSMRTLARRYRCNESTVRRVLHEEGGFIRRGGAQKRPLTHEQKTRAAERIFKKTATKQQVMKELGIGWAHLHRFLAEEGVE